MSPVVRILASFFVKWPTVQRRDLTVRHLCVVILCGMGLLCLLPPSDDYIQITKTCWPTNFTTQWGISNLEQDCLVNTVAWLGSTWYNALLVLAISSTAFSCVLMVPATQGLNKGFWNVIGTWMKDYSSSIFKDLLHDNQKR
jgi:hypothetical protein